MHYYQFNIADYRKDTVHLTPIEHYIYRTLIDWYYLDEKPISKETQVVTRRLGLGLEHSQNIQNVLSDFFKLKENGWHHARIELDIREYGFQVEKNRLNGKLGGRPKKTQVVTTGLPNETTSQPLGNPNQEPITTNHKPLTTNQEPSPTVGHVSKLVPTNSVEPFVGKEKKIKKEIQNPTAPATPLPDFIDPELWQKYCDFRKAKNGKGWTRAGHDYEIEQCVKLHALGQNVNACIKQAISRSWSGIFPVKSQNSQQGELVDFNGVQLTKAGADTAANGLEFIKRMKEKNEQ